MYRDCGCLRGCIHVCECVCLYGDCVVFVCASGNVCMVIVCVRGWTHSSECVCLYNDCVVVACLSGNYCIVFVRLCVRVCMCVNVCVCALVW